MNNYLLFLGLLLSWIPVVKHTLAIFALHVIYVTSWYCLIWVNFGKVIMPASQHFWKKEPEEEVQVKTWILPDFLMYFFIRLQMVLCRDVRDSRSVGICMFYGLICYRENDFLEGKPSTSKLINHSLQLFLIWEYYY